MIIKVKNKKGFAQIQNTTLRDKRLSLEARGALCEMLSYSEGFRMDVRSLMTLWGITRGKLLKITNQLKQFGYLEIVAIRDATGRIIDKEWYFYGESQGADFRHSYAENSGKGNFRTAETTCAGEIHETEKPYVGENLTTANSDDILKQESSQKEEYKETETHTTRKPPPAAATETAKKNKVVRVCGGRSPTREGDDSNNSDEEEYYRIFRDAVESWWCRLHGILRLPPNINTAGQLRWLFDNKFTLPEIRQYYEYATTDPEEKAWRTGPVTLGAIVKGIAQWKIFRQQIAPVYEPPKPDFSTCPDCQGRGVKPYIVDGVRLGAEKCRHNQLATSFESGRVEFQAAL